MSCAASSILLEVIPSVGGTIELDTTALEKSPLATTSDVDAGGILGEPLPYTVQGDDFVTLLLLAGLLTMMTAFSVSRQFFVHQVGAMFRGVREDASVSMQTTAEMNFQIVMLLQSALMLGITGYYVSMGVHELEGHGTASRLWVAFGVALAYFLVRVLLYACTCWTFFESRSVMLWMKNLVLISSMEGVLLFPAVLVQIYFGLPLWLLVGCVAVVFVLEKALVFYRLNAIFFSRNGRFLHNFLYFCALEVVPLACAAYAWGAVTGGSSV